MTDIYRFVLKLFSQRVAALAATAFFLDLAFIGFCISLLSEKMQLSPSSFHIEMDPRYKIALVVAFGILYFVFWFILYIQTERNLVDVFSDIREKLYGNWLVTYDAVKASDGRVIFPQRVATCSVQETLIKKLEFLFTTPGNNPIFVAQNNQVVKDIALRANEQGGFTLFYFYETFRELAAEIKDLLPSDDNHRAGVDIEIFAILTFDNPGRTEHVQSMTGKWYDLNGNMMRIFKLVDLHEISLAGNSPYAKTKLFDVPIEQKNFDADMGSLDFLYLGQKKSTDT